jgi:hypothetical protein
MYSSSTSLPRVAKKRCQEIPPAPIPLMMSLKAPSSNPSLYNFVHNKPHNHELGRVVHVVSPNEFFFKPESPEWDLMDARMQNQCDNPPPGSVPRNFKNRAVAVYVGNRWQRAQVIDFVMANSAKVQLVDTGKIEVVWLNNIRILGKQDAHLPVQTICCVLRGVWNSTTALEEMLNNVGKVEAIFVSNISNKKFSTIITKSN